MTTRLAARAWILVLAGLTNACSRPAPRADAGADTTTATIAEVGSPAPGLRVVTAGGETFDLAAQRGRAVALFFGYTHCPDVCPLTLADFKTLKGDLGPLAERVRWVFVTVDPKRDTPALAQRYARQFDTTFVGLSPDSAALWDFMRGFGVGAFREATADTTSYFVAHSAQVFVIGPDGRVAALVAPDEQRRARLRAAIERALGAGDR